MKTNFKMFVVAGAVLCISSLSFAQAAGPQGGAPTAPPQGGPRGGGGRGGPGGLGGRMLKVEDEALTKAGATPAQLKQVAALRKKEQASQKAFMDKHKGEFQPPAAGGGRPQISPELMEEIKKMREAHQDAMKKILGDKFPAYEAALKEARKQFGGGRGAGKKGAGAPGAGGGGA